MQQTTYNNSNVTAQGPADSRFTAANTKLYLDNLFTQLWLSERGWDECPPCTISDYDKPPPSLEEDGVAKAAQKYYESLSIMTRREQHPAFYFKQYREVLKRKTDLESKPGYKQLTAAIRGQFEADNSDVVFGTYAHLCNEAVGRSITRNPATQQGLLDYFEIGKHGSLPPESWDESKETEKNKNLRQACDDSPDVYVPKW